jgi:hypothetical protein
VKKVLNLSGFVPFSAARLYKEGFFYYNAYITMAKTAALHGGAAFARILRKVRSGYEILETVWGAGAVSGAVSASADRLR